MEMCECVCDEMLEPMKYNQSCVYVSVPLILKNVAGQPSSMLEQIASAPGPGCPTANCTERMSIKRYLMSPTPRMISVALTWNDVEAQPNSIHLVMQHVPQRIDLQRAFHGVTQPTVASLKVGTCVSNRLGQIQ